MCNCGKYYDEAYYAGCRRGVYEAHSPDYCHTKDLNTWRTRLFVPIAEFFDRLAGAFSSKAMEEMLLDARGPEDHIAAQRKERREALARAMFPQETQE